jgi:molybdopterin molybdotransferase
MALLPLDEAQARLLALATPLPIERVDVPGALGRYLAEPLRARRAQPAAHASAMDGYAVASADLAGPWRVIGESAAGHPFAGCPGPGEAVRISTGALLPAGCDTVIIQENTARDGDRLTLTAPAEARRHVRLCGSDFAADDQLLRAGARIGPAQLALALAAGHRHLAVRRPPRIAIIDSGDELAADPEDCAPHQVPASNGAMIAALASALPCEIRRLGPVADDLSALTAALHAAEGCDVVVTTGGASVGDHDLVRPALQDWGAQLDFWKVAIRPGKPLMVARRPTASGAQLAVGLPGNPVSSMVTAYLFLLPLLRALLGATQPLPRALPFTLAAPLPPVGDRREFVRAMFDEDGRVAPVRSQDSGALGSLALSDVLVDRPDGAPAATPGETVRAYLLENGGLA